MKLILFIFVVIFISAISSSDIIINITLDKNSTNISEICNYYIRINLLDRNCEQVLFRLDAPFSYEKLGYYLLYYDIPDLNLTTLSYNLSNTTISEINRTKLLESPLYYRTELNLATESNVMFVIIQFNITEENRGKDMTLSVVAKTENDFYLILTITCILIGLVILIGVVFLITKKKENKEEDYSTV